MIVAPRPPTRARLKAFENPKFSYLRALEHELIPTIPLEGRVLDFGGGGKAEYIGRFARGVTMDSLNIDPEVEPTILHDANTPFPIADATYDTIVSLNTLEHVQRDGFALGELVRVLKPGGSMHIVVPFLYRVHASPSDYHRHTAFWWEAALESNGIPRELSRIEPMMWGRITTAFSFIEYTRLRFLRRVPLWLDMWIKGISDHEYPMGYYIQARRPEAPAAARS